ncbi:MAG: DUF937 domain-containing protein [Bauldia sp.]|nr:DUF937 domain-containing protein [Bauldia sp.]
MAKSPSLLALLGLLAVAGYQNRDRIGSWLDGMRAAGADRAPGAGTAPGGGFLDSLGDSLGGLFGGGEAGAQGGIGGALADLVDGFTGRGKGDVARSWIETGPNRQTSPQEVEAAIGSDVVDQLVQKTGLSRAELLDRLSSVLPAAVDSLTPDGHIPSDTRSRFANA